MMVRRSFAILGVVTLSGTLAVAQQKPEIKKVPIEPTRVADAAKMFTTYCAACHGVTGKGDGPAATALKKTPADLTKISARNGGTFPEAKVSRYIQGNDEVAAHGNRDMPIWGDLFSSLNNGDRLFVALRVKNLTDYLRSIQQ
jgi:mono/diheme cytochrome c family protein